MTLDELRGALASAVDEARADAGPANYLARGPDLGSSDLSKITFDAGVTSDVAADVIAYADSILGREWLAYDPSYQLAANQALVDEMGEVPELARLQASVDGGRAPLDSSEGEPVHATIHRLGNASARLTAYRLKGAGIATRRPRGIRVFLPREGVWERVDQEVLYYEPKFDALVFGGRVFVTAITTLQRALGSDSRARALAARTFQRATSHIVIEGAEALAEAVASDPVMVAKMAQLSRTLDAEPDYAEVLTTERLLLFLDANPQIRIATTGAGDDRRLVFEPSPQKRYLIVKALADDYLHSELSQRTYEVGSKSRIDEQSD